MKNKFFVFAGMAYYPAGGWKDFLGHFESVELAIETIANTGNNCDWWQICELVEEPQQFKLIKEGKRNY